MSWYAHARHMNIFEEAGIGKPAVMEGFVNLKPFSEISLFLHCFCSRLLWQSLWRISNFCLSFGLRTDQLNRQTKLYKAPCPLAYIVFLYLLNISSIYQEYKLSHPWKTISVWQFHVTPAWSTKQKHYCRYSLNELNSYIHRILWTIKSFKSHYVKKSIHYFLKVPCYTKFTLQVYS